MVLQSYWDLGNFKIMLRFAEKLVENYCDDERVNNIKNPFYLEWQLDIIVFVS